LQNPHLDEDIQPLALTEGDIDDLVVALFSGVKAVGPCLSQRMEGQ
jgi:hypothetical protein